jgi:PIN domain nuclease of toxin-antitoxin system
MKYLVDTHVLLWSFFDTIRLSNNVKKILLDENNDIYYSPVNLWEISIKYRLKKLDMKGYTPEMFYRELESSYYLCKEMNSQDAITAYKLPMYHKDPFDRYLIWECLQNAFVFLSADAAMEQYKKEGLNIVT